MILRRIIIENFKSLRRVDLSPRSMNLFIGANASGKSNFLDALRVLQGVGNGFTISEILDGKPKSATSAIWDGIRGGSSSACFAGPDGNGEVTIEAHGWTRGKLPLFEWEFLIAFSPAHGQVTRERLKVDSAIIYDSDSATNAPSSDLDLCVRYLPEKPGHPLDLRFERARPVLRQFARGNFVGQADFQSLIRQIMSADEVTEQIARDFTSAGKVAALLANTQCVDPTPALLRDYSQAHHVQRMGDHGENFAALIHALCLDDKVKDAYLSWLRQLRPEEVDDVGILRGAVGEPLFMLREGGREFAAPVLSDGTLRFAAIAAAFFQPDMPGMMTIEEIENGIHASRLRLLVELLRDQGWYSNTQIMATTHSPVVLTWLREADYQTTFFCKRDESTGESTILPLTEVPHFMDAVKKQHVSDLFAEGWLEAAL